VLASIVSAIPEVLGQDYDFLFECGDYEELAKKMEMILTMPSQKLDFLVEYLQERLRFFDSRKMANEVQKIYLRGKRG
jgi:glycosyltransferase involved in cell wall biosynthesis